MRVDHSLIGIRRTRLALLAWRMFDKLEKLIRSRIEAVRGSALSMKNVSY